jgi:hypothetical protein
MDEVRIGRDEEDWLDWLENQGAPSPLPLLLPCLVLGAGIAVGVWWLRR